MAFASMSIHNRGPESVSLAAFIHLILHGLVPLLLAVCFARRRWRSAWLLMMATLLVDLDHLLATPLYDPERCSITYHPLHRWYLWPAYGLLLAWPRTRWLGVGLLCHMLLDAGDCARQTSWRALWDAL
jgi:hypothetical protein